MPPKVFIAIDYHRIGDGEKLPEIVQVIGKGSIVALFEPVPPDIEQAGYQCDAGHGASGLRRDAVCTVKSLPVARHADSIQT
jgi:hypothetical protein